jgi:hypothetical protein
MNIAVHESAESVNRPKAVLVRFAAPSRSRSWASSWM